MLALIGTCSHQESLKHLPGCYTREQKSLYTPSLDALASFNRAINDLLGPHMINMLWY